MIGETVYRLRPAWVTTGYGDREADWSNPTRTPIVGAAFAPGASRTDLTGRTATLTEATLYLSGSTSVDVVSTDRFEVRGTAYAVDGEVGEWRSPFDPGRAGCEIPLKRVDG